MDTDLIDRGDGATAAEVDAALRQRKLFSAVEHPVKRGGAHDRAGDVDVG